MFKDPFDIKIPYEAIATVRDKNNKGALSSYTITELFDSMQAAVSWGVHLERAAKQDEGVTIERIEYNPKH